MAHTDNSKASASAIKHAEGMWSNFTRISTICGGVIAAVLVLMALFLV